MAAGRIVLELDRRLGRWNLRLVEIPVWLVGLVAAALWFAPFVWMVSTSLKYPSDVLTREIEWLPRRATLGNYVKMFELAPVARWMLNSVLVSTASTALCLLFGAMAGYALARMRFPGRRFLFGLFLASLMVPTEVSVVPLLLGMIKIGWANSYQALILPTIANVLSVYIFRQFFLRFPEELEDAARMDGAGHFTIFWRVAFPLARAPLIAAAVIIFTLNWNNFLWPLLVTFEESMKTMPVGIAAFTPVVGSHTQLEGYALAMAGVTLLSLPSLALFFFLQRHFIQGIASSGLKA